MHLNRSFSSKFFSVREESLNSELSHLYGQLEFMQAHSFKHFLQKEFWQRLHSWGFIKIPLQMLQTTISLIESKKAGFVTQSGSM